MEEIKIKQIEVFRRCFEIIKSSFRNPCNECELYNNCHDKSGTFIYNFCSRNLTNSECFKEIKNKTMLTREEAKRRAELYSALAEGKTIQIQCANGEWTDVQINALLCIDDERFKYRIKPEPKYRPFKNQEECWLEMHKHPDFGWGLDNIGEYVNLSRIRNECIYFTKGDGFDFSKALNGFRFTDGKPFGIIED